MNKAKQYEAFQYEAFTKYGIPNQVTELARDWVLDNTRSEAKDLHPKSDLGYNELGKMTDYYKEMQEFTFWQGLDDYKATIRFMQKDEGVGRGSYRTLLKLFHLFRIRLA